tara:strand:+ start:38196 stop:39389 length:1194 start_codon:yes stop_codon:yes gene_type:complete
VRILTLHRTVLIASAALLVAACSSEKSLPAPPQLTPATEAQAEAYGEQLLEALQTCNPSTLRKLFDVEGAQTIALRQSTLNGALQDEFLSEVQRNLSQQTSQLFQCEDSEYAAGFNFEGIRELDGQPSVVISNFENGALLWQFPVGTNAESAERAVIARDYFNYSQGMLLTAAFTDYDNLVASDVYNRATVIEVLSALYEGEPASLERLGELTKTSRLNRKVQLAELEIRAFLGAEEYKAARERFYKRFPNHDPMHLLSQIALRSAGDEEGALEAIDALDAQIGTIPGLDVLRLRVLEDMNAPQRLLTVAKRVVRSMPDRESSWHWLLDAQKRTQDYPGMLATLKEIGERFDTIWDRTEADNEFFKEFAATPYWEAYHGWMGETFELEADEAPTTAE